jgi:hypothetical protein
LFVGSRSYRTRTTHGQTKPADTWSSTQKETTMLATKAYDATAVGSTRTIAMADLFTLGARTDAAGYERFAQMEIEGKLKIDLRHPETSTGKRYTDMVRFTRLR